MQNGRNSTINSSKYLQHFFGIFNFKQLFEDPFLSLKEEEKVIGCAFFLFVHLKSVIPMFYAQI